MFLRFSFSKKTKLKMRNYNFSCFLKATLFLNLKREHRLRVFYDRVLRNTVWPKRKNPGAGENYTMRSFRFVILAKYYSRDQINEDGMGGACGTHYGDKKCTQSSGFRARWILTTWKNQG
jgi:hypothetical protein